MFNKIIAGAVGLALLAISGSANATLIGRAIIDFNDGVAGRFALDNLSIR